MPLFTPRERDILHLVADLHDRAEIQAILGCQLSTLNRHLCHIYEKAEIHSFFKLARYAVDNGYGCRLQAIVQETQEIKQPESKVMTLTGKDVHKAIVTIDPHIQPKWHKLIRPSKEVYEKIARELNYMLRSL
jgi:DNA-binding CsgD family transcriptional regulator